MSKKYSQVISYSFALVEWVKTHESLREIAVM